jgi:ABC-type Fe3+/spermidine/putrescine transport system ATPase subunit
MQGVLKQLQREIGITFVYVTHDQEEAFSMSDRVGIMNAGKLEQVGAPRDVYHRPQTLFVADFVGASNQIPATILERSSGSRLRADLGGLGVVEAPGSAALGPGSAAAAILRPESTGPIEADGGVRLSGRLVDIAYLGPQVQYTIDAAPAGEVIVLHSSQADEGDARLGDERAFTWPAASIWLVPA